MNDLFTSTDFNKLKESGLYVTAVPVTKICHKLSIDGKIFDVDDLIETLEAVRSENVVLDNRDMIAMLKKILY